MHPGLRFVISTGRNAHQFGFGTVIIVVGVDFDLKLVDALRFDVGVQPVFAGVSRKRLLGRQVVLPALPAGHQLEDGKLAVLATGAAVGGYGAEVPTVADSPVSTETGRIDTRPQATLRPVKEMHAQAATIRARELP